MIFIFDIDGTIANLEHRLPLIQQKPADWRAFFAACGKDQPIADVIGVMCLLAEAPVQPSIVLVSGRSDECRELTIEWLFEYSIPYDRLYMRKAGDHREDYIVKSELLDQVILDYRVGKSDRIYGVFEDRDQVVKMYRDRGLRVYQVADGKF